MSTSVTLKNFHSLGRQQNGNKDNFELGECGLFFLDFFHAWLLLLENVLCSLVCYFKSIKGLLKQRQSK